MASTNKTSNYELSQFLGTDKPAWLSDYNTDMSKIDTQMKANADAASAADGAASSANTSIGTLSNLTTDAKTSVVAAVNEVDSHADSAQSTASSALSGATAANTAIAALQSYLSLNNATSYSSNNFTIVSGGGSIDTSSDNLTVVRNTDGTLCKIYGYISVSNVTVGQASRVKLNVDTGLRPASQIVVNDTGICQSGSAIARLTITINTDGTVEFSGYASANNVIMRPLACVIFVQDFGDQS